VDVVASQVALDTIATCRLGRYSKVRVTAMNKTNRLMIATLASLFSLVMVAPAAAQVATDGNMPDWQSMSPTELL
jgi:hypothetical protein